MLCHACGLSEKEPGEDRRAVQEAAQVGGGGGVKGERLGDGCGTEQRNDQMSGQRSWIRGMVAAAASTQSTRLPPSLLGALKGASGVAARAAVDNAKVGDLAR